MRKTFREELRELINKHSKENGSDTPDLALALYLDRCLDAFNEAVLFRERLCGTPKKEITTEMPIIADLDTANKRIAYLEKCDAYYEGRRNTHPSKEQTDE